jgi:hypothetical protein
MLLDLAPYVTPLSQTPSTLRAAIEGRPDSWLDSRHAEGVVSPREAVAHLVLRERESWVNRIRWVLESGESKPYAYVATATEQEVLAAHSVEELLNEFETLRAERIAELEALQLTVDDLQKPGLHKILGPFKLGQLLSTWVAHDLYHLGQIFKSYSSLYVDEVGPWQQFLNLPQFN